MADREKLIELMIQAKKLDQEDDPFSQFLADFLISNGSITKPKIYPIEVKSGKRYKTESLEKFVSQYRRRIGKAYIIHPKNLSVKGDIICIPSYMTMCL